MVLGASSFQFIFPQVSFRFQNPNQSGEKRAGQSHPLTSSAVTVAVPSPKRTQLPGQDLPEALEERTSSSPTYPQHLDREWSARCSRASGMRRLSDSPLPCCGGDSWSPGNRTGDHPAGTRTGRRLLLSSRASAPPAWTPEPGAAWPSRRAPALQSPRRSSRESSLLQGLEVPSKPGP